MGKIYAFRPAVRARKLRHALNPIGMALVAMLCGYVIVSTLAGDRGSSIQRIFNFVTAQFSMPVEATQSVNARFHACSQRRTPTCVTDGDTVRIGDIAYRIADIDTPEVFSPQCPSERVRGDAATARLVQLLNKGPFEMVRYDHRDVDIYGRKLRVLMRAGRSIGQILVAEGLARTWDGARHSWCV